MHTIKLTDREILMIITEAFEELKRTKTIKTCDSDHVKALIEELTDGLQYLCNRLDKQN